MTATSPDSFDVFLRRAQELRDRARHWVRFVGVRRLAAGAVGVVVAATAAWWLVRPAAAPVEVAIPAATRATIGEVAPTSTVATMLRVHVAGAVKRPGVYSLAAGARVVDAVRAAGGASDSADLERINLAQTLLDTEQVMVPRRGSTRVTVAPRHVPRRRAPSTTTTALPTETGSGTSATPSSPAGAVNLNTAGVDQLDTLPGIGPATAKAIVSHRTRKGPFSRVEDLLAIDGIGPKKLDAIRDLVSL